MQNQNNTSITAKELAVLFFRCLLKLGKNVKDNSIENSHTLTVFDKQLNTYIFGFDFENNRFYITINDKIQTREIFNPNLTEMISFVERFDKILLFETLCYFK